MQNDELLSVSLFPIYSKIEKLHFVLSNVKIGLVFQYGHWRTHPAKA